MQSRRSLETMSIMADTDTISDFSSNISSRYGSVRRKESFRMKVNLALKKPWRVSKQPYRVRSKALHKDESLVWIMNRARPGKTFPEEVGELFIAHRGNIDAFFTSTLNWVFRHPEMAPIFVEVVASAIKCWAAKRGSCAREAHDWWGHLWKAMETKAALGCLDILCARVGTEDDKKMRANFQFYYPGVELKKKVTDKKMVEARREISLEMRERRRQHFVGLLCVVAEMKHQFLYYAKGQIDRLVDRLKDWEKRRNFDDDKIGFAYTWLQNISFEGEKPVWFQEMKREILNPTQKHPAPTRSVRSAKKPWRRCQGIPETHRKLRFLMNTVTARDTHSEDLAKAFQKDEKLIAWFLARFHEYVLLNMKMAPLYVRTVVDVCQFLKRTTFSFKMVSKITGTMLEQMTMEGRSENSKPMALKFDKLEDSHGKKLTGNNYIFCGYLAIYAEMVHEGLLCGERNCHDMSRSMAWRVSGNDKTGKRRAHWMFVVKWTEEEMNRLDKITWAGFSRWDFPSVAVEIAKHVTSDNHLEAEFKALRKEYAEFIAVRKKISIQNATILAHRLLCAGVQQWQFDDFHEIEDTLE
ncbi:hypothetical protein QR680_008768 [Steinernema hermaphroditum]|uniref:Uncharacterized protein n=1 Tax=Steinernema hermaphroditum TaxID=289476 RepID=A0AA39IK30_9BILA|nr:hypothetical protein QR680_008768 [Steinernema hermaphroditum]